MPMPPALTGSPDTDAGRRAPEDGSHDLRLVVRVDPQRVEPLVVVGAPGIAMTAHFRASRFSAVGAQTAKTE